MMFSKLAAQDLLDDLGGRFPLSVRCGAQEHLQLRTEEWALRTQVELAAENPFVAHEQDWEDLAAKLGRGALHESEYLAAAACYGEFCQAAGYPFEAGFWAESVQGESPSRRGKARPEAVSQSKLETAAQLLGIKWREVLDRAGGEWELREIARRREALHQELEAFLRMIQALITQLEGLGLEPSILLDLSKGKLSAQDIEQFKRWARYLSKDEGVKSLCDLLGKLRQIELSERVEQVKVEHMQEVWQPDLNSREEIYGVCLGRDMEHALPSEMALLADPETTVLFDMKYVESRLMCFDMRGMQSVDVQHLWLISQRVNEVDKMGPMVICVDTSGSMHGMPETVAKAVTLYMATKAHEQKRSCYLINFSTGIETLDFSSEGGMKALIRFLQLSFQGGTDVAPAMKHALETMQRDRYAKADLLVISDFVMGRLPSAILSAVEAQRVYGNRFYSLVVNGGFHAQNLSALFDQEWIYDTHSSHITELVGFNKRVAAPRAN